MVNLKRFLFPTLISALLATSTALGAPANLKKVVWIVFENTSYGNAIKQPYFKKLASQGAVLSEFYAETHPSLPNYLAMVSGSTFDVEDDGVTDIAASNIADLIEAKGKTWKAYAEGYPGNCFNGESSGKYARKHVPFLSFDNIRTQPVRCARIRKGEEFYADLQGNTLPDFSYFVPDLDDDGHDTGAAFASQWLQENFEPLVGSSLLTDVTLFVTFDEDDSANENHIYTTVIGAGVKPGSQSDAHYTHYSMLRTLEDAWGLGSLGRNDAKATSIQGIWNELAFAKKLLR